MPALAAGTPTPGIGWPDDRFHRLAALALLEQLRASLLVEDSASLTLERWCDEHHLATPARLVADRDPVAAPELSAEDRARLQVGPAERIAYRHVRLSCGGHVLSEADNWYVPGRLTPEMNRTLDTTRTPFGKAVLGLRFHRATLSSRLLWSPLPADWDTRAAPPPATPGARLAVPDALIENRALLTRADGVAFSLVVETYRRGLLDFAAPPATP